MFNRFPYTDFHELNLDWILNKIKQFENDFYTNLSETITNNVNKLLPKVIYNKDKENITLQVVNSEDSQNNRRIANDSGENLTDNFVSNITIGDDNILIKDYEHDNIVKKIEELNIFKNDTENIIDTIKWSESIICFSSVEEMLNSDINFLVDDIIICLSRNNNNVVTSWKVSESGTEDIVTLKLKNSKYANFITPSGELNILSFPVDNTGKNSCSDIISYILNNVSTNLYFPKGRYKFYATLPEKTIIRGDGSNKTDFIPDNKSTTFLTLTGYYIKLSGFHIITEIADKNIIGIKVTSDVYHSIFKDIIIENCLNGFQVNKNFIWNTFYNVAFYGNFNKGFFFHPANTYFNNNTFYSCRFNNNVNEGIYITGSNTYTYDNSFIGCNIEMNNQDRFNITHISDYAVFCASMLNFIGCYFEDDGDTTFGNFDFLSLQNCSLSVLKNVVNNNNENSYTNFIGCKSYNITGSYVTSPSNHVATLGNNFTI